MRIQNRGLSGGRRRWLNPLLLGILVTVAIGIGGIAARPAAAVSPSVVISQVYGGGGNSGATYTHDFIELFNRGSAPVSLNSWSVQYASATGTGNFGSSATQLTALPNITLQPGQYFLIQEASTAAVGSPLLVADLIAASPIAMSGSAGKVALVNSALTLGCNGGSAPCSPTQAALIIDLVGYGSANYFEGAAAVATLSNTAAAIRAGMGCTDADNNAADFSAITPAPRNSTSPLSPCAAPETAPSVLSVTPSGGPIPTDSNLVVAFSEPVVVIGNWFTIDCSISPDRTPVDTLVSGGPSVFTLNPAADFVGGESCTITILASGVTDQDGIDPPDNMSLDFTVGFSAVDVCVQPFTPIYTIQGTGLTVPVPGVVVTTQGVAVGDYEFSASGTTLRGFYIQDPTGDGDGATSDGIFVFNGNNDSVTPGDVVRVTGTAEEFQGQSQISAVSAIAKCGTGTVAPTAVSLPFSSATEPERYEGMLVQFSQPLYVTEHFQLGRFGQVVLTSGSRLPQPTSIALPGATAGAIQAANDLDRIILDDASQAQNPDPIIYARAGLPLNASNTLRGGDSTTSITGVMTYTWGGQSSSPNAFRVRPENALDATIPNFTPANPRPIAAPVVGGTLKVASFNVLNYFLTLDIGTQPNCGPVGFKQECRGAETSTELIRQQQKLTAALVALNADIVGLIELENSDVNGIPVDPLGQIVADLNAALGGSVYAAVDTGIIGTDTIRVGFIYKIASATPLAGGLLVDTAAVHNRPPVSQVFQDAAGGRVNVVVNHFKSKSCSGAVGADTDQGDGQGCFNPTRTAQAQALADFISGTVIPATGESDVLVIGDLNSYAMEDPITVLQNAGYVNLVLQFGGQDAYSYVFDGQWGYLDHALASPSLLAQVTGTADFHINSDEPSVFDYNTNFKSAGQIAGLFSPDQYRTSDHDPVVIGLKLNREPARFCSVLGDNPGAWPDVDVFTFDATAGELIHVRVEASPGVLATRSRLLVFGPFFIRMSHLSSGSEISGRILRAGRMTISFSELFGRDAFVGDYCVIVSSSGAAQDTLHPTALTE